MSNTIDFPIFKRNQRVATKTGYAGTVTESNEAAPEGMVLVLLDANGRQEWAEPADLTPLSTTSERRINAAGSTLPRAWTMGGGVD